MSINDKHPTTDETDAQSLDAIYQRALDLHTTQGYQAFLDFIARLPQYAAPCFTSNGPAPSTSRRVISASFSS